MRAEDVRNIRAAAFVNGNLGKKIRKIRPEKLSDAQYVAKHAANVYNADVEADDLGGTVTIKGLHLPYAIVPFVKPESKNKDAAERTLDDYEFLIVYDQSREKAGVFGSVSFYTDSGLVWGALWSMPGNFWVGSVIGSISFFIFSYSLVIMRQFAELSQPCDFPIQR